MGPHILYSRDLESAHSNRDSETALPLKKSLVFRKASILISTLQTYFQANDQLCIHLLLSSATSSFWKSH